MYKKKAWKEILTIVSGKSQKSVETINGKYLIYGSGGIIGHANEYLCPANTVIVGRKGTIDRPIYVTEPFWNIDTAFGVVAGKDLVPKFLYFFCLSYNFKKLDKSTGRPSVSKSDLLKIEMPIPTINEQQRIVSRIEELFSELDKGVETLQTIKQQLETYRQAVLKEAMSVYECPIAKISDVCSDIVDCPHSTPKWVESGYLCLRTTNFRRGFLDLTEPNYVSQDTFNSRNKRLVPKAGDVLYSREGSILGIACIMPDGIEPCLGQRMMLLRASSKLNNKFLMYYFNSPMVTNHVITTKGGTGSPHINVGDIKQFDIPFPNIEQQNCIVALIEEKFSVCDSIERMVDNALAEANVMRQSILKKAFKGGFSE